MLRRSMAGDAQPDTSNAPSSKALARAEDRGAGAMASRSLLAVAGMVLLIGFFMPWLQLGSMMQLSGFTLWTASGEAVEVISGPRRVLLFMVPLSGVALIAAAYVGHRVSVWTALVASALLLAYGGYTIVRLFLESTGLGMWMVVGAAMLAFAVALIGLGSSKKA
jgi:hypothetical protein